MTLAAALQRLSPRERSLLLLAATVLMLFLGWALLWRPLDAARDTLREQVAQSAAELAWMRQAVPTLAGTVQSAPARVLDGRSLLARVDAGAREAGLGDALLRVEPVSASEVRVSFGGADFDALVAWLEDFTAAQGASVTELSVQRVQGVGRVDARLALREGGGR